MQHLLYRLSTCHREVQAAQHPAMLYQKCKFQTSDFIMVTVKYSPQQNKMQPQQLHDYRIADVLSALQVCYNSDGQDALAHVNDVKL